MNTLYHRDFYGWAEQQYILFKNKEYEKLDHVNLLDEIRSLRIQQEYRLESLLQNWLMYKLMIILMPEKHTKEWDYSLNKMKRKFFNELEDNPSMESLLEEMLEETYRSARYRVLIGYDTRVLEHNYTRKMSFFSRRAAKRK